MGIWLPGRCRPLAQTELRAERAEQWLVRIRHEVDGQLMPSLVGVHNRLTPPEGD